MTVNLEPGLLITPSVRLLRRLGAGGMGSVWIAEHLALRTQVVVKFMSRELAASPEAVERFSREAAAAAQVKSPHVVQMLDHGVAVDGIPYIVMELLEGEDLARHLHRRRLIPPREVAALVAQIAKALTRAHASGIIHRDIKPENVFLCDSGAGDVFVKVLDFGIAKTSDNDKLGSSTRSGTVVGTPSYMSPEQIMGTRGVDLRSDLWSLAIVAYEGLTGKKPFDASTVGALAVAMQSLPVAPTAVNPALPVAIDEWFAVACARDPLERFDSAREMSDALLVAVGSPPSSSVFPVRTSAKFEIDGVRNASDPNATTETDALAATAPQGRLVRTSTHEGLGLGILAPPPRARRRPAFVLVLAALLASGVVGGVYVLRTADPPPRALGSDVGNSPLLAADTVPKSVSVDSLPPALPETIASDANALRPATHPRTASPSPSPSAAPMAPTVALPGATARPHPQSQQSDDDIK